MVPNTSELLPEPEIPVNTVSRRLGISTLTSLRLLTRAPVTRIRSWRSAAWVICSPGSAQLVDADHVAGRITEGTVANTPGLVDRLLNNLGAAGLQPVERLVQIVGGQRDRGVGALG